LTQQLDFRLSDFPSSVSTFRISDQSFGILFSVLANRRTDEGISDRSFGISSLRTGAPTEVFRIDHLVFRPCEQAHRWRYFGSIIWYFVFCPCEQAHRRRYFRSIIWYFVLANRRTDGGISDRSFGISSLRTGTLTEVFRIDHLVFRPCEQAHRRRYFGSIIWYFVFCPCEQAHRRRYFGSIFWYFVCFSAACRLGLLVMRPGKSSLADFI
jgi:hypothetical protein